MGADEVRAALIKKIVDSSTSTSSPASSSPESPATQELPLTWDDERLWRAAGQVPIIPFTQGPVMMDNKSGIAVFWLMQYGGSVFASKKMRAEQAMVLTPDEFAHNQVVMQEARALLFEAFSRRTGEVAWFCPIHDLNCEDGIFAVWARAGGVFKKYFKRATESTKDLHPRAAKAILVLNVPFGFSMVSWQRSRAVRGHHHGAWCMAGEGTTAPRRTDAPHDGSDPPTPRTNPHASDLGSGIAVFVR